MSVIELKDIMKTYQMGDSVVHALYHVNLKIEPGEFTSVWTDRPLASIFLMARRLLAMMTMSWRIHVMQR